MNPVSSNPPQNLQRIFVATLDQGDREQGPKGDPEMVPTYVDILLPMFCQTFQSSMVASVKRASLGLIKKMLHYLDSDMMKKISLKEQ